MAENKTKKTDASVDEYLAGISPAEVQADCRKLVSLMEKVTKQKAHMWGSAIVGVGHSQYMGSNGKAVDWFPMGFSARKAAISIYFGGGLQLYAAELAELGTHKTGKGCLYLKKLADVDVKVLEKIFKKVMSITK